MFVLVNKNLRVVSNKGHQRLLINSIHLSEVCARCELSQSTMETITRPAAILFTQSRSRRKQWKTVK